MNSHAKFKAAKKEVTSRFYRVVYDMLVNKMQGGLVYELYNSKEASEQWTAFNKQNHVVGPEVDLIQQLIDRENSNLVSRIFVDCGPGDTDAIFSKSLPLLLAARGNKHPDEMQYHGIEASDEFRNNLVKYISPAAAVQTSSANFFEPLQFSQPDALITMLGVTISNLTSEPDGKLPYRKLVQILRNFSQATNRNGQFVHSTDAFDRRFMKGEQFVESYNREVFRKVYHIMVDRFINELGMVIHDQHDKEVRDKDENPTNFKLDENRNVVVDPDNGPVRLITPTFVWMGEEIEEGDGGHKVGHNLRSSDQDIKLVFEDYEQPLLFGEERTALNAIKWPDEITDAAYEEAGNYRLKNRLKADDHHTTLNHAWIGDGGSHYRAEQRALEQAQVNRLGGGSDGFFRSASRPVPNTSLPTRGVDTTRWMPSPASA